MIVAYGLHALIAMSEVVPLMDVALFTASVAEPSSRFITLAQQHCLARKFALLWFKAGSAYEVVTAILFSLSSTGGRLPAKRSSDTDGDPQQLEMVSYYVSYSFSRRFSLRLMPISHADICSAAVSWNGLGLSTLGQRRPVRGSNRWLRSTSQVRVTSSPGRAK